MGQRDPCKKEKDFFPFHFFLKYGQIESNEALLYIALYRSSLQGLDKFESAIKSTKQQEGFNVVVTTVLFWYLFGLVVIFSSPCVCEKERESGLCLLAGHGSCWRT